MEDMLLGVEIGGAKLQLVLARPPCEIIASRRGSVPVGAEALDILEWIAEEAPTLIHAAREHGGHVGRIGVGFGGPVDTAMGRSMMSHQVGGWQDVGLKSWFEQTFGLPTLVANDSNAAGWAEFRIGAGKGTRHFFYTNIGSGIGGALIISGHLHNGQGFGAGELGHMRVPDWTSPESGASDILEHLCSGWAIERRIRKIPIEPGSPLARLSGGEPENRTCAMLSAAALEGDAYACAEIGHIAHTMGLAIANVITLAHPERVAVGGGVSLMGETLFEPLRRAVHEHVFKPYRGHYAIVPCGLGEQAVPIGAILLAQEPA